MPLATRSIEASRHVARRAFWQSLVANSGRALSIACAVSLAMVGAAKIWLVPAWWIAALFFPPAVALVIATALTWKKRWSLLRAASAADEQLASADAIRTAVELGGTSNDPFVALAVDRGEDAAARVLPSRVVPDARRSSWVLWPTLAAAAALAWIFAPQLTRITPPVSPSPASVTEALNDLRQVTAAVAHNDTSQESTSPPEASPTYLKELQAIEHELAQGNLDANSARSKAAEALHQAADLEAAKLAEQQSSADTTRSRLAQAARSASSSRDSSSSNDLRRALSKGDIDAAAEAVDRLRTQAPRLSPEEREKLAEDLNDLASAMESVEPATPPETEKDGTAPSSAGTDPQQRQPGSTPLEPTPQSSPKQSVDRDIPKTLRDAARTLRDDLPSNPAPPSSKQPAQKITPPPQQIPPSPATQKPENATRGESSKRPPENTPSSSKTANENGETTNASSDSQKSPQNSTTKPDRPPSDARDRLPAQPPPQPSTRESPSDTTKSPSQGDAPKSPNSAPTTPPPSAPLDKVPPSPAPAQETPSNSSRPSGERARQSTPPPQSPSPDSAAPANEPASDRSATTSAKPEPNSEKPTDAPPQAPREANPNVRPQPESQKSKKTPQTQSGSREAPPKPSTTPEPPDSPRGEPGKLPENLPKSLPPIPKMSDEALEQLARRFRDLSKSFDKNQPSQQQIDRLRRQAQDLLEKSTPEQREQLERLAKKLANELPAEDHANEQAFPSPPETPRQSPSSQDETPGARPENGNVSPQNSSQQDDPRSSAREASPPGTPTHDLPKPNLPRSTPPRGRPSNETESNTPGPSSSDAPAPRRIGPTPQPWSGKTETVDARPKSISDGGKPRLLAELLNPDAPPRNDSSSMPTLHNQLLEAARGAERAIEQQSIPTARSEYIRRVFRRYVERTSPGIASPATQPAKSATTPDAADAAKGPPK